MEALDSDSLDISHRCKAVAERKGPVHVTLIPRSGSGADFHRDVCGLAAHRRQGKHGFRSAHTGTPCPDMLRGKSPCRGAESAGGRPQGLGQTTCGDASRKAAVADLGFSQHHRHAVSAIGLGANRTGLTLPMPPNLVSALEIFMRQGIAFGLFVH